MLLNMDGTATWGALGGRSKKILIIKCINVPLFRVLAFLLVPCFFVTPLIFLSSFRILILLVCDKDYLLLFQNILIF